MSLEARTVWTDTTVTLAGRAVSACSDGAGRMVVVVDTDVLSDLGVSFSVVTVARLPVHSEGASGRIIGSMVWQGAAYACGARP